MSKKHSGGSAPVPPGNRSNAGPAHAPQADADEGMPPQNAENGSEFNDQDAQRRLGGYRTAGEAPIQQPSKLNDGQ